MDIQDERINVTPTMFKVFGVIYFISGLILVVLIPLLFFALFLSGREGFFILTILISLGMALAAIFSFRVSRGYFKLRKYVPTTVLVLTFILVLNYLMTVVVPILFIYIALKTQKNKELFIN